MSRYIDADKLQRHGNRGGVVYWRDIEAQPTADVRENVRGEWIPMFGKNVCNRCGHKIDIVPTNYCSNCGADMRQITALSKNAEIDSNSKRGES